MGLEGKKIAILAADDYEDLELLYPLLRLKEEGAEVVVVGVTGGPDTCMSKHGYPAEVDLSADKANADEFDGVISPGGWAPDRLRRDSNVLAFVKKLSEGNKVVAAICHGGWVLASADIIKGRKTTSFSAIKDDMANAGATWVDEEVVKDGKIITSRIPSDLPAFLKEILASLKE